MAPKKAVNAERQFVYVVLDTRWAEPAETLAHPEEAKTVTVVQGYADLETANESARTYFSNLMNVMFPILRGEALGDERTNQDGTITIFEQEDLGWTEVSVVQVPFLNLEDLHASGPVSLPPTTVAKSANGTGSKRKSTEEFDGDDDDDSSPRSRTTVENHVAPGGWAGCLDGLSFIVTGTLDSWTRDQVHALIEEFGGSCSSTLKEDLDYVVLGTKPGPKKMVELNEHFPQIEQISQADLYAMISSRTGNGSNTWRAEEEVTKVCVAAKKVPKKRVKKSA